MSLQMDYEKLSRRATQERSSSSGHHDDFCPSFAIAQDSPHRTQIVSNDTLNISVQSDVATSMMRPENKLDYEPTYEVQHQEQNKTIDLSDFVEKQQLIFTLDESQDRAEDAEID